MNRLIIICIITNLGFSKTPKPLKNQQNKSKTEFYSPYIEINKAKICYIYGERGDRLISVNFDKNNSLISKTNYNKTSAKHTYVFHQDCKNNKCAYYIHR